MDRNSEAAIEFAQIGSSSAKTRTNRTNFAVVVVLLINLLVSSAHSTPSARDGRVPMHNSHSEVSASAGGVRFMPHQSNCPSQTFYNESATACVKCHYSCFECVGPNAWDCILCDSRERDQIPSERNQTEVYNPSEQVEMLTYRCKCYPGFQEVGESGCKKVSSDTGASILIFLGVFTCIFGFSYIALKCFPKHFTNNPFVFVPSDQDNSRANLPGNRESHMNYFTTAHDPEEQRRVAEPRLHPLETESPTATGRNLFTDTK